MASGPH